MTKNRNGGRSRIPRLPDAVRNLLDLHSLEAVVVKEQWVNGSRMGWVFNVFPQAAKTTAPLFSMQASASLENWITKVEMYKNDALFQGVDFESLERRVVVYLYDELTKQLKVDIETISGMYRK